MQLSTSWVISVKQKMLHFTPDTFWRKMGQYAGMFFLAMTCQINAHSTPFHCTACMLGFGAWSFVWFVNKWAQTLNHPVHPFDIIQVSLITAYYIRLDILPGPSFKLNKKYLEILISLMKHCTGKLLQMDSFNKQMERERERMREIRNPRNG